MSFAPALCAARRPALRVQRGPSGQGAKRVCSSAQQRTGETTANCHGTTALCDGRCCAAAPTTRGRSCAVSGEREAVSSVASCGCSKGCSSMKPESLTGLLKKFLGSGQVHQRGVDVLVAKIRR